jgi:hypothetical protein
MQGVSDQLTIIWCHNTAISHSGLQNFLEMPSFQSLLLQWFPGCIVYSWFIIFYPLSILHCLHSNDVDNNSLSSLLVLLWMALDSYLYYEVVWSMFAVLSVCIVSNLTKVNMLSTIHRIDYCVTAQMVVFAGHPHIFIYSYIFIVYCARMLWNHKAPVASCCSVSGCSLNL